jgi:hypothetical protein
MYYAEVHIQHVTILYVHNIDRILYNKSWTVFANVNNLRLFLM